MESISQVTNWLKSPILILSVMSVVKIRIFCPGKADVDGCRHQVEAEPGDGHLPPRAAGATSDPRLRGACVARPLSLPCGRCARSGAARGDGPQVQLWGGSRLWAAGARLGWGISLIPENPPWNRVNNFDQKLWSLLKIHEIRSESWADGGQRYCEIMRPQVQAIFSMALQASGTWLNRGQRIGSYVAGR